MNVIACYMMPDGSERREPITNVVAVERDRHGGAVIHYDSDLDGKPVRLSLTAQSLFYVVEFEGEMPPPIGSKNG